MFVGLDNKEVIEHISELDPEKGNPTKFLLGMISCFDRTRLAVKIENKDDPEIFYDIVKKGLKGIKGIKNKQGEVKDYDAITDDVMDLLPAAVVKELFFQIININFLSEEEAKN